MKQKSNEPKQTSLTRYRSNESLFAQIALLLNADLENPTIEMTARALLIALRERSFEISNDDLEDPECLTCLFMTLLNAAQAGAKLKSMKNKDKDEDQKKPISALETPGK